MAFMSKNSLERAQLMTAKPRSANDATGEHGTPWAIEMPSKNVDRFMGDGFGM